MSAPSSAVAVALVVKSTKRKKSDARRASDVSDRRERILTHHLDEQARRLDMLAVPINVETPLFDNGEGALWYPDAFGSAYARELARNGGEHLRLHGARHSFASIALEEGVQLLVIGECAWARSRRPCRPALRACLPALLKDVMNRVSERCRGPSEERRVTLAGSSDPTRLSE